MKPYHHTFSIDCSTHIKVGRFRSKFPPTLNNRVHWSVRAKLNRLWRARTYLALGNDRPVNTLEKCHVIITKHSTRSCDADNLATMCKSIFDGLVDAGVALDDSMEYFSAEYRFQKCKRNFEKIEIELREVI